MRALNEIWDQNSKIIIDSLGITLYPAHFPVPSYLLFTLAVSIPKRNPHKIFKNNTKKTTTLLPCIFNTALLVLVTLGPAMCLTLHPFVQSAPPTNVCYNESFVWTNQRTLFFSFITTRVQQLKNITTTLEPLISLVMIIECLYPDYTVCSIIKLCISAFALGNITQSILKV